MKPSACLLNLIPLLINSGHIILVVVVYCICVTTKIDITHLHRCSLCTKKTCIECTGNIVLTRTPQCGIHLVGGDSL